VQRLIAEVDPWSWHGSRSAFAHDRAATNTLQLAGYVVPRFTDHDLARDAARVARRITRALAAQPLMSPPVR
jgi:very-short-patch-repair endonuclease